MRNSSSYWLAAYIVSMVVILAVTIAVILNKAPDKTCPLPLTSPIGVERQSP